MKSLIEQKDSRKLALLEYLATTKTTSVAACCVYLNVSEKVLLLELMQLTTFMEQWANQLKIVIEKDTISLIKDSTFEMETVYVALRKNSTFYSLLNESFQAKEATLDDFAGEYYCSYNYIYRAKEKIAHYIAEYNFQFDAKTLALKGNKQALRFFFYNFYWNVLKGKGWPFGKELRIELEEKYQRIETDIPLTAIEKEKFLYWRAICYLQVQKQQTVDQNSLYQLVAEQDPQFAKVKEVLASLYETVEMDGTVKEEEIYFLYFGLLLVQEKKSLSSISSADKKILAETQPLIQMKTKLAKENNLKFR
ncbi:hypothetical protein CKN80_03240 [Carnobacterium divergens]|uniref:helix-turn-helix domain-containing protein n=1 Tax=Carnobacterium divergens TaxID=2748 RepID=UPI0010724D17|nr:helix-turn-helix domain-containing protein [Carnobacterium divergens]TFJ46765.1 hypothetical protein CKN79_03235 [Carnobacterium divergens]TFJ53729.1 hypothetical protein CKN80_03240 [Carnobacterium divergens]